MDARGLSIEIKAGSFSPSYLFSADEPYAAQAYLKQLTEALLDGAPKALSLTIFDSKTEWAEIENAIFTMGAFGSKRVVVLRDDALKLESVKKKLAEYPKNPHQGCFLIVFSKDCDKRGAIYKAFSKYARAVEFPRYDLAFVKKWISSKLQAEGISIDEQALSFFAKQVGYTDKEAQVDFGYVACEVEKAACASWNSAKATVEGLKKVLSYNAKESLFMLSDAVLAGDASKAITIAHRLIGESGQFSRAIAELARVMRNIIITSAGIDEGMSQGEISKAYGIHAYSVKLAAEAMRRYPATDAKRALLCLRNADMLVKSGFMGMEEAFDALIADISTKIFMLKEA